jgi:hypothetical protein
VKLVVIKYTGATQVIPIVAMGLTRHGVLIAVQADGTMLRLEDFASFQGLKDASDPGWQRPAASPEEVS